MNTNNQLPSDIDYIGLFDHNTYTGAKDFLRRVEKRLDSLDDPFRGVH